MTIPEAKPCIKPIPIREQWKKRNPKSGPDIKTSIGNRPGYVYVLTNSCLRSGLVKIGYTQRNPQARADELYKGITGVPGRYEVAFSRKTCNCVEAEKQVHKLLKPFRANDYREFFNVSVRDAMDVINRVADIIDKDHEHNALLVKCNFCDTQNRITKAHEGKHPICGKCRALLPFGDPPVTDFQKAKPKKKRFWDWFK